MGFWGQVWRYIVRGETLPPGPRFCTQYGPEIADGRARYYVCPGDCQGLGICMLTDEMN